jgi:hypothetical protein
MRRAVFTAIWVAIACLVAAAGHPNQAHSAGLETTFVRVSLDNLRIGASYNIREMANLPLAVYNTGDTPVSIKVEPTVPMAGEARPGYEPIPDAAWISFKQDTFQDVGPGRAAMTDVVISIPGDQRYLGKKYQVMIWPHTVGGAFVACGLKSEVLFSTSSAVEEPAKSIGLLPTEMIIPHAEAGKPFKVKEQTGGATLRVFNPFDEDRTMTVSTVPAAGCPMRIREGYFDCPDPNLLELAPDMVVIPAGGHRDIEVTVRLPEDDLAGAKGYVFIVAATQAGSETPANYSAIYVDVK